MAGKGRNIDFTRGINATLDAIGDSASRGRAVANGGITTGTIGGVNYSSGNIAAAIPIYSNSNMTISAGLGGGVISAHGRNFPSGTGGFGALYKL